MIQSGGQIGAMQELLVRVQYALYAEALSHSDFEAVALVHTHVLPEIVVPAEILAAARVWALVG